MQKHRSYRQTHVTLVVGYLFLHSNESTKAHKLMFLSYDWIIVVDGICLVTDRRDSRIKLILYYASTVGGSNLPLNKPG